MASLRLIVVVAVVVGLGTDLSAAQARCPQRGTHTWVQAQGVRVFQLRGPHGRATYACYRKRHLVRLDTPDVYPPGMAAVAGTFVQLPSLQIRAPYVGFLTEQDAATDNPAEQLVVVDTSRVRDASQTQESGVDEAAACTGPPGVFCALLNFQGASFGGGLIRFLLRSDGAFAWTYDLNNGPLPDLTQVWEQRNRRSIQVAASHSIDGNSLRFTPHQRSIQWTEDGRGLSSPL